MKVYFVAAWQALWLTKTAGVLGLSTLPPLAKTKEHLPLAREAMDYFDSGTDPFHVVKTTTDMLDQAGFVELSPDGDIEKGGKYYFTRNRSTLVAFTVGEAFENGGCKIIGGHTDSPNLRVKPRSKRTASGCIQLGVECYGGGLWHTWFDRCLGLSGRVLVRNSDTGRVEQKLVKVDRALLRVSNLAIHLQTAKEREAFKINKEDHLSPILALEAKKALEGEANEKDDNSRKEDDEKDGWVEHQEPALLQILAHELDVDVSRIVDFELSLFDIQKANIGGAFSEFVHSARLDNLASCFLAVKAIIQYVEENRLAADSDVSMVVLYDHEEVGSNSAVGAASPIMSETIQRIATAFGTPFDTMIRKSFCCSVDQAHALHPNYASKHEKAHMPKMNGNMVIKRNSNQRYATNVVTGLIIREVVRKANLPPIQEFIVRQDCGCGSTIGPAISTATGIRTIDLGCPQLSMHSIRETMGVCDLSNGLKVFMAFLKYFAEVDESIEQ